MPSTPDSILRTVFGFDRYKPLQREIIQNVLAKRDTLVIMPTGGGKSLCYQLPALIFPGLTVVVSPLISLMKDQVEQLSALGVPALFLNSSLPPDEYQANMNRVRLGQVKLLYAAPETLLTPRLFNLLNAVRLDCLTIDEAHCISEWGHDFRPEYRQLVEVRRRFPQAVCLALTATATPRVRQDIQDTLGFEASNEFIASFNRENLLIEVAAKDGANQQTLDFLKRFPKQAGIIYCFSRAQVDKLAAFLAGRGYAVRPYHAGLLDEQRKANQEAFIRDDVQIIVATIAFGMGINKPNVRFIVHYDLPKSIESYYQEIGRAGRDGLPAHCLLLYSYGDVAKLKYFLQEKEGAERQVAEMHLNAMTRYAESTVCRRVPLLAYFGEEYAGENCGMCDNCLDGAKNQMDITIPAQKFLSCAIRTGEKFGATHLIDVLRGSRNEKVLQFGHQNLSTYGIGKDLSVKQWQHLHRQLVQQGFLAEDPQYHGLRLTPKAHAVLKNREAILGSLVSDKTARSASKKAGGIEHDAELFAILRQKRKELADEQRVPPYVIFSDRTLVEMAAYYPMTPASLLKINGVGSVKLANYGQTFLAVIQEYCQARRLSERPKPSENQPPAGQMELPNRSIEVGAAFNAGQTVDKITAEYQLHLGKVLEHLTRYALSGSRLRASDEFWQLCDLPETQKEQALAAFEAEGAQWLKPVFEHLNGAIPYDDLKILRLHYLCHLPPESSQEQV